MKPWSALYLRTHHDSEVDDAVVVAAQDDSDDVLADVVDVAFHGGQYNRAGVTGLKFKKFSSKDRSQAFQEDCVNSRSKTHHILLSIAKGYLVFSVASRRKPFSLHERDKVRHSLLHHPRRFYNLQPQ